jgi:hypothetical protein
MADMRLNVTDKSGISDIKCELGRIGVSEVVQNVFEGKN